MSERAELERQLVEAADDYQEALEWHPYSRSKRRRDFLGVALALADALRDEQRVGGRPWGGE